MARGGNRPNAGRKKGTPNKSTAQAHEIMDRLKVDPIELLALIAARKIPCGTCIDKNRKPTGRTKYILPLGQHWRECAITKAKLTKGELLCTCDGIGERDCLSCFGTTWERIPTETMLKASAELAQYKHPKKKAIEVSGPQGGPIENRMELVFVEGKEGKPVP